MAIVMPIAICINMYRRGRRFALRDRLQKSDAIVALAGTRGNLAFLEGKVLTATKLYKEGWAPILIFSGRFSKKVTDQPQLISLEELEVAASQGRITSHDITDAAQTWDIGLGAAHMRNLAIKLGVPAEAIHTEEHSLHTLENASFTAEILRKLGARRIILVTSPFHQLRTYLTFGKVLKADSIEIINYYANTGEWHPFTWFLSARNRALITSELQRITRYKKKGDIL